MNGDERTNINVSATNSAIKSRSSDIDHSIPIPRTLSPRATERRTLSPNSSGLNISADDKKSNSSYMRDSSGDQSRAPMLSPSFDHKDYNRLKYYSALRTGYAHLGMESP